MTFAQTRTAARSTNPDLPTLRVALLAEMATAFLTIALRGVAAQAGWQLEIYEGAFGLFEEEVLDPNSAFHKFQPEAVILFPETHYRLNNKPLSSEQEVQRFRKLWHALRDKGNPSIVQANLVELDDGLWGNYAAQHPDSRLTHLRRFNDELVRQAREESVFLANMNTAVAQYGLAQAYHARMHYQSGHPYNLDFLPMLAERLLAPLWAAKGHIHKVLALDLDNTLWGGVLGDDGISGLQLEGEEGRPFRDLQHWALALKERGILLLVCSRNDEQLARKAFASVPGMVLNADDISLFLANQSYKSDNLREAAESLNLGLDAFVFLDDDPFERNLIRSTLPQVMTPELPDDPEERPAFLRQSGLFETLSHSTEDLARADSYRQENQRQQSQAAFTSIEDYLQSLQMQASATAFDAASRARVAQLTQRTNQFNLCGRRYDEADIKKLESDENYITLAIRLKDRFGEYGLVAAIIAKVQGNSARIETWVMSCRAFKRGLEFFTLERLLCCCRARAITTLYGEYQPTEKNLVVKDLYPDLGFTADGTNWKIAVDSAKPPEHFIEHEQ